MKYDISKATAPAMPHLGKGTKCIKLLCFQASKDMLEPLVPMFSPLLAHTSVAQNFISRPHLEGVNGHNGPSGGRFGQQLRPVGLPRGGYMPRFPTTQRLPEGCKDFSDYYLSTLRKRGTSSA